ncbi:PREDICTED: SH3 domain and tetratricopeptide repeat-containing protein 1-like isoform X1 [Branchiostoma belcheri]|uniref:SH3 domain and tetratricopeptide repeat-containing protein 1-like isoform X1 n=1 Tax=Branchiostoma belcheri TaxID=7741 RepID=A0A6P5AWC5_BRABE|nr:PREDICTED: SH3 domain and tetratricopeptide repeat-containing protein 1-like isoform X1 [Branchiostoma belcheri]
MLPRRKSLPRSWDPRPLLSDLRRSLRSKMASSIIRRRRGSKMAAATTDDIQDKKMRMRDNRPKSFHLGAHPGEALGLKPGQPLSVEDIQALKATLQGGRPATFHPGMLSKNKSTEGGKPARVKEITAKLRPYLDSGEMPPVSVYKELKDRLLNEDVSKRLSGVFQLISVSLVRTDANTTSLKLRFGTLENAHALWTHSALGLLEPLIETVLTSPMRSNVGMEDLRMRVDVEEEDYLPVFETLSEGDYFVRVKDDKSGLSSQEDIQTRPGEVLRVVQADDVAQLKVESLGGERTGSILRENVAHVGPFQDDMLKRCTEKRREPESVPVVNAENLHAMVPGTYVVEEDFEATAGDEISVPSGTRVAVAVEDRPGPLIDWCLVRCLEDSKQGFLPRSCLKLEEADAVDPTSPALEKADPFGSLASGNNGGTHSIGAVSRAVLDRYRQTHYDRGLKSCADAAVASLKALTSRETTRSDSRRSSLDDLAVGQENKDGGEIRSGTTAILTPAANAGHSQTGATGSPEEENNEESAAEDNGPSTASEGDKENIHYLRSILKSAEENEDLKAVSDNLNKLLHVLIREDGEDSLAESAQCAKKLQEIGAKLEDPKTQAAAEIFLAQISKQKGDFTKAKDHFLAAITYQFDTKGMDKALVARLHCEVGSLCAEIGDFDGRNVSMEKALSLLNHIVPGKSDDMLPEDVKVVIPLYEYYMFKAILANDTKTENKMCRQLFRLYGQANALRWSTMCAERALLINKAEERPTLGDFYTLHTLYAQDGKWCSASLCLKIVLEYETANPTLYLKLADLCIKGASSSTQDDADRKVVPSETRKYFQRILDLTAGSENRSLQFEAHTGLFAVNGGKNDVAAAVQHLEEAISLSQDLGMVTERLELLTVAGSFYQERCHEGKTATSKLEEALSLANQTKSELGGGIVCNKLGLVLQWQGYYKQAEGYLKRALLLSLRTNNKINELISYANIASLYKDWKNYYIAEKCLRKALLIEVPTEGERLAFNCYADIYAALGNIYLFHLDNKPAAKCYYEMALAVAMWNSDKRGQMHLANFLGTCQGDLNDGQEDQAPKYFQFALPLAVELKERSVEGVLRARLGEMHLKAGNHQAALSHTKDSLGIFIDLDDKKNEARTWKATGDIYSSMESFELADMYYQKANIIATDIGDLDEQWTVSQALGKLYAYDMNELNRAVDFFQHTVLPLAEKTGDNSKEILAHNWLTHLMYKVNRYDDATTHANRAWRLSAEAHNPLCERVACLRLARLHLCQEQYELAEHYFLQALSLTHGVFVEDVGCRFYLNLFSTLADITLNHMKDAKDSATYYEMALGLAMHGGFRAKEMYVLTQLAKIYHTHLNDKELSLEFYNRARLLATELRKSSGSR